MATISPATGARVYFAFGVETQAAPGTPVAVTDIIPVEPDNLNPDTDMGRKALETAVGTLVVERYLTEDAGSVKGGLSYPIFQTLGQKLIYNAAFADSGGTTHVGTLDRPKFVTAEVYRAGQGFRHAGLLPKSIKWALQSKNPTKVTIEFDGLVPAEVVEPTFDPAAITLVADQPYVWGHAQPILTIGGGLVASKFCDSVEIDVMFDNQLFYGASGQSFPTLIVPGPVKVSGKWTQLFTSVADYQSYLTQGQTPGPLQFTLRNGAHSIVWDIPSAFYEKHDFKQGLKAPIVEDLSFHAIGTTAGDLLTYTVTNADGSTYSAAA